MKKKWKRKEFWRGATQEDRYEYLVDGPSALDEIKKFHESEEAVLIRLLQSYVDRKENIAFIEIGCGPGRVIRKVSRLAIENPTTWGNYIKHIIGVDFEMGMIERAIRNLMSKERKIRDWIMRGTAYDIALRMNSRLKKVREGLRKKVIFINADARLPFLKCEPVTPVVAIMFGTVGNIPGIDDVLKRISELCWPHGKALIVGFNREHYTVGIERYNKLAQAHFGPLQETEWIRDPGVFKSSPGGFYSRWFFPSQFKEILQRHFENGKKIEVIPLDETAGFYAVVKPKATLARRVTATLTFRNRRSSSLHLLCPRCGESFESGALPLPEMSRITCATDHRFTVEEMMGLRVPVLEVNG